MITNYQELPIREEMKKAIAEMGFTEMTEIQQKAIPELLAGKEVIAKAPTGTGKTCAFGVPMVQRIQPEKGYVQGVILCPTRELCLQITEELQKLGKYIPGFSIVAVYGGQSMQPQINALRKNPQIVVATPGRLMDHMRRRNVAIDRTEMIVLDEADEMLDMGFVDDIEEIMRSLPVERQTLLFSATMPRPILSLTKKYMKAPKNVTISKEELTVPLIEQYYFETKDKIEGLCRLLDAEIDGKLIIFCRTKKGVDDLSIALSSRGYMAEGLHGDLSQNQRDRVMKKFREGAVDVLIATDVAARGIDVDNITHVINFDIPQDPESYVHRIGRTGRAGNTGVAMTLSLIHISEPTRRS